ncbi:MAG: threonine--tRNA ligase [Oscillospiraceae bacterium]|nr:threonine--tRNA ligase [Oscillospiraceae bacterium]
MDINAGRHSLAHIMAQAVTEMFPGAKLGIGPCIDDGFYYDFDLPEPVTPERFAEIEERMKAILKTQAPLTSETFPSKEAALKAFAGQPYKEELIGELPENEPITAYRTGEGFFDLCRGPHVENTRELLGWAYKIHAAAGAYWRGSEKNPMLTRLYAYAFPKKDELKALLAKIEEAKKRDHRKLGPQLDLFFLHETAPGMPYWLPKGLKLFNTLLDFWRREHEERGYQEISAPLINNHTLWVTSGHWEHYSDIMFSIPPKEEGDSVQAIKPMNCPNAMNVYARTVRSYRELPLRYSDCDVLHRNEASGTLHGLLRVRMFRQDDSHNFITREQIPSEINAILDIADRFYDVFGLTYKPILSTRPEDFMGDPSLWEEAERELRGILDTRFGADGYTVNEGDGAFYGPKIDLLMTDALGRPWQMGTIQLDFQLPHKFGLTYADRDGSLKEPVVIHRVIYGSLERFIGILIEQFAGAFPFWLSPVQVGVVPVRTNHNDRACEVLSALKNAGLRCEALLEDEGMGGKVNKFRQNKVPYTLIIGDRETETGSVSVKIRGGKQAQDVPLEAFVSACAGMNETLALELAETFM